MCIFLEISKETRILYYQNFLLLVGKKQVEEDVQLDSSTAEQWQCCWDCCICDAEGESVHVCAKVGMADTSVSKHLQTSKNAREKLWLHTQQLSTQDRELPFGMQSVWC